MSYYIFLLVLGVGVIGAVTLPRHVNRRAVSLPALQVLAGAALFGLVPTLPDVDPVRQPIVTERLSELVVIVSLTGAGLMIDRAPSWRRWGPTWRLLAICMPLTIAATALLGWAAIGLAPAAAVLLGGVIAPTDPVLASDVQVAGPNEGDVGEVPIALTGEAGLNDALAFPFVNAGIAMLAGGAWFGGWLLDDVVVKLSVGTLAGWLCGRFFAWLIFVRFEGSWLKSRSEAIATIGATLAVYGLTEVVHGYGFLAVFVAAVTLRHREPEHEHHEALHAAAEAVENLGSALVLLLVGGAIASGALSPLGWKEVLVGIAIVALVRPVTGLLSLLGSDLDRRQRWIAASFGIRGVGSVYYLAHAAAVGDFADIERLWAITIFVICLSLVVHGSLAGRAVAYAGGADRPQLQLEGMPPEEG
ncbi:cation:proton antiporter [Acidimicrobiia bacterium EGI L10123]|uniref:cation:proton antiporter n=1 Tax=Salinilacustrithrix flava TaxID=2957203 RepID=UPI003D7C29DB|nr:cation:proton antiporter [Acidimicrobiia bacterium EGI L10123]